MSRFIATHQSPDSVSIIAIRQRTDIKRPVFEVQRLNLAGELVNVLARRTAEAQARVKANEVWSADANKMENLYDTGFDNEFEDPYQA